MATVKLKSPSPESGNGDTEPYKITVNKDNSVQLHFEIDNFTEDSIDLTLGGDVNEVKITLVKKGVVT